MLLSLRGTVRSSTPAGGKPGKVKLKIRNMVPKPNPDAVDSSRSLPAKPPRPEDSRHQQKISNLASALNHCIYFV